MMILSIQAAWIYFNPTFNDFSTEVITRNSFQIYFYTKRNKHYAMYRNLAVAYISGCHEFITVAVNVLNNVPEKKMIYVNPNVVKSQLHLN